MTASGWREEGLLASALADGEAGISFCPSVNHPAWFAELQRGERETVSYDRGRSPEYLASWDESDRDAERGAAQRAGRRALAHLARDELRIQPE